jgi:hypothetical protein
MLPSFYSSPKCSDIQQGLKASGVLSRALI